MTPTLDHLRAIADRVREIGGKDEFSCDVTLDVGYDGTITDHLADLGGERRKQLHPPDDYHPTTYVIQSCRLTVNGVRFHAQWSRPATADEITTEQRRQEDAARAANVTDDAITVTEENHGDHGTIALHIP